MKEANRIMLDVRKAASTLREIYAVETRQGISVSPVIMILNVLGTMKGLPNLPALPIKMTVPERIVELRIRSGFKGLCRSVVHDLSAISRLGSYNEKLRSQVKFKNGQEQTHVVKTEDIQFFGKRAHWKRPM